MKKYLIAIPCLGTMPTATVAALTSMKRVGAVKHSFLSGSVIHDARNMLAKEAIESEADRILFIDSDMYFESDVMERLAADLDDGKDFVCGLYFTRRFPMTPCIYNTIVVSHNGIPRGISKTYEPYPKDTLFEIAGCGFGMVMMNTQVIIDVVNKYGPPFNPFEGVLGEDLSFCHRARQLGYNLWCDSRIKVGHVGQFIYGEQHYQKEKDPGQA